MPEHRLATYIRGRLTGIFCEAIVKPTFGNYYTKIWVMMPPKNMLTFLDVAGPAFSSLRHVGEWRQIYDCGGRMRVSQGRDD